MASATARVPQPGNEEGRPGTGRPSNFANSNDHEYNLHRHRAQRLIALAGISPSIAAVMAPMVFGGAA
jgi:hypothetical protein